MNKKIIKCEFTTIEFQSEKPNTISTLKNKRKHKCEICNKVFSWGSDLRKHLRIHTQERPFTCVYCNRKFRQAGNLKNHIASQHGSNAIYTCYYCNKSFPIKERLRLHMRIHSGERPYKCSMCPKSFARGGQIAQHMNSHYGIKKYKCQKCTASFTNAKYLSTHLKWHPSDPDTKECQLCGENIASALHYKRISTAFKDKSKNQFSLCKKCSITLNSSERKQKVKKLYKCNMCGVRFAVKSQLNVHQRIHSGERPYQCQVCDQSYSHSSVLAQHVRKHTGEKPFKCYLCAEKQTAFSQLPHFKNHMRAIHGKDKAYKCPSCSSYFKTKMDLRNHLCECVVPFKNATSYEIDLDKELSRLRLLVAVLLTKISSKERLRQLGFEKRLIDNVLIEALKNAGREICTDENLMDIEKLKANVRQFLEWSVPKKLMNSIKEKEANVEKVLNEITQITD